jgi:hypothetical protein
MFIVQATDVAATFNDVRPVLKTQLTVFNSLAGVFVVDGPFHISLIFEKNSCLAANS